jgi:hypothetical protein
VAEDKEKQQRKKELQNKEAELKEELSSLQGREYQLYGQLGELQEKLRTASPFTQKQLEADIENLKNELSDTSNTINRVQNELNEVQAQLSPLSFLANSVIGKAKDINNEVIEKALLGVPGINVLMQFPFTKKIILKIVGKSEKLLIYIILIMCGLCCFVCFIAFSSFFAAGPGQDAQVNIIPSLDCASAAAGIINNLDISDSESGTCLMNYTVDSFKSRTEEEFGTI